MQFLKGLFGARNFQPPLLTGDKELQAAYAELGKGQTGAAQKLLSHHDAAVRYFYAFELGTVASRELIEAWCKSQPDCLQALFLRAAQGPQWAWEARSAKAASQVKSEQWTEFSRRLALVRQDLETLIQRAPEDPNPHALMLIVAKGENQPPEEHTAIWKRLHQLFPNHYAGHRNYLDSITAKWGGSYIKTMEFTRDVIKDSPEGSEMPILLFAALTEHWLFIHAFEKDPARAQKFVEEGAKHSSAVDAYRRSLGSERFQFGIASVNACNEAAFWFYLSQQPELLAGTLKRLGDRCIASPWNYLGDPGAAYQKARDFAKTGG